MPGATEDTESVPLTVVQFGPDVILCRTRDASHGGEWVGVRAGVSITFHWQHRLLRPYYSALEHVRLTLTQTW